MAVLYSSTRGGETGVSASQAILKGLACDGGLFVPSEIPTIENLSAWKDLDYKQLAYEVMKLYFTDFTEEELKLCIERAYDEKFDTEVIAPMTEADGVFYLELFHGATIAFKDMALSILPHLLTTSAKKNNVQNDIVILTATSGDTGKAALAGFADVEGTKIIVFYPKNGVSKVQELQMVTQKGANTAVVAIHGNFDCAQSGVKAIFEDKEFAKEVGAAGFQFSSANSINIGRLVPQIVYYVYAYAKLLQNEEIVEGEEINVVVPTGNFGNILAAYYAKEMGLPVKKLICASNSNSVLTEFLTTGVYNRNREFFTTISPSMDILISSNLERLLYSIAGSEKVTEWMKQLSENGKYEVDADTLAAIKAQFAAGCCDDEATKATIAKIFKEKNYLCDTHTAVAVKVFYDYKAETGDDTPAVIASTASPFKFSAAVLEAVDGKNDNLDEFEMVERLASVTGKSCPEQLANLRDKAVRFDGCCSKDSMDGVVFDMLGI